MRTESGAPFPTGARFPQLKACESLSEGVRLHLAIPTGLVWFEGHFPSRPVLPGVAQIAWVVYYARRQFRFSHDPSRIERVKFLETVPLDRPLLLELQLEGNRVNWQLFADDTLLSRGRLYF
ncbi:MAG TPA: hypothetical protein VFA48_12765 [Gammaproteobacteria bacterium]|nr:hypothetical protein [Gammaproteobacteria bacterium]